MKLRICISVLLAVVLCGGFLSSCAGAPPQSGNETAEETNKTEISETVAETERTETVKPVTETEPAETDEPLPAEIDVSEIGEYSIVYASEPRGLESLANSLAAEIKTATGKELPTVCDTDSAESVYEILIGRTNRSFSQECYADSSHIMQYEVRTHHGKVQFVTGGPYSGMKCAEKFKEDVLLSKNKLKDGVSYYAADLASDSQKLTDGADIRVMTANVLNYHWGEESYENIYPVATRAEIFAGVLLRFLPDFVGLQEADENWRDILPYYLNSMAEKEKIYYTHQQPNAEWKGKTVINYSSLLYRSDLYNVDDEGFKGFEANYQSSYCQRVATYAKYSGKTDASVQAIIVNTQWAHESDERILSCVNEEAELVNALKAQYPGVPIFCTGDFNSDIKKKSRDKEDAKATDPEGYKNAKNRYEFFLGFVGQTDGVILSSAAKEKGVLITAGGCRTSAKNMSEDKQRALDSDFIDHIVLCGGYADVLRHDTIRSNGCHVMSDHSPIYADISLKQKG